MLLWGTADEEKDEDCESEDETTSWSEVTSDDEINDWLMSRFVALSIDDDGGDMNIVLSFIVSRPDASSSINMMHSINNSIQFIEIRQNWYTYLCCSNHELESRSS